MLLVAIEPGVAAATTVLVPASHPAQNPEPPPGVGEEFGKASPVALVVILLLAVVTVLLIRGMTKRIRRLPQSFDPPADEQADEQAEDVPADSAGDAEQKRP